MQSFHWQGPCSTGRNSVRLERPCAEHRASKHRTHRASEHRASKHRSHRASNHWTEKPCSTEAPSGTESTLPGDLGLRPLLRLLVRILFHLLHVDPFPRGTVLLREHLIDEDVVFCSLDNSRPPAWEYPEPFWPIPDVMHLAHEGPVRDADPPCVLVRSRARRSENLIPGGRRRTARRCTSKRDRADVALRFAFQVL